MNPRRTVPDGEFVLYWMQSTQRLEENWALRYATIEADRLGRPLLIHQGLDPTYEHASDRHHIFVMEGAREIAARAVALGYQYQFVLRRTRADDRRVLDQIAARASLVVTDLSPTAGVLERTRRFAERAPCRVVAVDSMGIVPGECFPREEYAARTIRPKLEKLLAISLEPVEDRLPRRMLPQRVWDALGVERLDLARVDLASEVARCEIDHTVPPVALRGGLAAARARLDRFVHDGLARYAERRKHPSDEEGTSRLSPYLRHGQIAAGEVARRVLEAAPAAEGTAFLNEMLVWRELALNFCMRNPRFRTLEALPEWVHRSMARHASDPRTALYDRDTLERGETHDALWNAAQRELVATGTMHNVTRMLWGKSVILWTPTYAEAMAHLLYLNDRYALDGRDPNSYAGIQWCFGKFDRPFAARPVWGTIRPMSLERARAKYDVAGYLTRWGEGASVVAPRADVDAMDELVLEGAV